MAGCACTGSTSARGAEAVHRWYCPAVGLEVDTEAYQAVWREALAPIAAQGWTGDRAARLPCREHHAGRRAQRRRALRTARFQDALAGHPATTSPRCLRMRGATCPRRSSANDRSLRRGQRRSEDSKPHIGRWPRSANTRIRGVFTRLWKRDGKPHYRRFNRACGACSNATWPRRGWRRARLVSTAMSPTIIAARRGPTPHERRASGLRLRPRFGQGPGYRDIMVPGWAKADATLTATRPSR